MLDEGFSHEAKQQVMNAARLDGRYIYSIQLNYAIILTVQLIVATEGFWQGY